MSILFPVFALVALTFCVTLRLGYIRYRSVARKQVGVEFYQAYVGDEPLVLRITSRHLVNLLELPILFYVGCLLCFVSAQTGTIMLLLAWSYVGLRFIHTLIHLGPNIVLWRFRVFALSVLVLVTFWVVLFFKLIYQ